MKPYDPFWSSNLAQFVSVAIPRKRATGVKWPNLAVRGGELIYELINGLILLSHWGLGTVNAAAALYCHCNAARLSRDYAPCLGRMDWMRGLKEQFDAHQRRRPRRMKRKARSQVNGNHRWHMWLTRPGGDWREANLCLTTKIEWVEGARWARTNRLWSRRRRCGGTRL